MASNDVQALIKRGIEAAQAGNKKAAKDSFVQALKHDPRNELAWMWMVSVVETEKERRFCLQKILEINPGNARARQALAQMQRTQLPDWLSRSATAEETLKPRPAQPAPPPAYEPPPADAPATAGAGVPAGAADDDWAAWPEPAFEGDDATPEATVDALRAEAAASEKPKRRSRRLRVILLLLLNIALIALAAIILVPRLTGSTPQGAPTAEATGTATVDASPAAPSATVTSPTVAATERPTSATSPTPRPTRRPTATATESAGPPLDTIPEGESADVEPPSGPPSEELTGPALGVDEANRVYRSANYSVSFPEGWTVTVKQEGGPVSQISLSRGAEDISEGPLPEAFAFATVDVFAASGESVAQLLASAQTVATSLVSATDIAREIDMGEIIIGGEAGAYEYYTVVSGPASETEVFVYAAAATVGDRDFVFMLFSTDEADREIAEAILETVTFERAE